MFGENPKRAPLKNHDGLSLDVVEIFPTIQGEGPFSGMPAIFIRLGGCNLACGFCDTEFEKFEPMALQDAVDGITSAAKGKEKLVVITGGEPLRQNITPLCEHLISQDFQVQIETNGTLYQELPEAVNIVCSPKNTGAGYVPIRPDLLARVDALKFIISKTHTDYQGVPDWCADAQLPPIFVQPMDEQDEAINRENTRYTMELAQRGNYRLSLQLHKILAIR